MIAFLSKVQCQIPTSLAQPCRMTAPAILCRPLVLPIDIHAPALGSMSSQDATPTERSPLLSASTSSDTLSVDLVSAKYAPPSIPRTQGFCITASLGILVFILS